MECQVNLLISQLVIVILPPTQNNAQDTLIIILAEGLYV